ncbi:hypothetical protein [Butyrivibrio sp.]|uniref:hypothetical protein n=1 Tax=Butyrivibrio sp. TaxID=28121 RepID=UPI0025BC7F33|nr:hypothetical protein [Butyrivibrio sp.]MBQ7428370.1 hypothetical protein [Butyrivibrio sp.]MBQ9303302.1 hypothetical protein [Butyrivibrio sp.]
MSSKRKAAFIPHASVWVFRRKLITIASERREGDITYVKLKSDNIDIANAIDPDHEYILDPNKEDIYWDIEDYQDVQSPMNAYIENSGYLYEVEENPFVRIDDYMKEDCYHAAALIDRYQKAEILPESYHKYDIELALAHGLDRHQYTLSTNEDGITIIKPMRQPSDCSWHAEIMQNDEGQVMGRVAINNEYVTDLNTLRQDHDKIFNIANQMIKIAKGEQVLLYDRDELSR